jgi:hypothetical protein
MSEALARIFAAQQAERNKKEQERLRAVAKKEREIQAFNESPVMKMLHEFADLRATSTGVTFSGLIMYGKQEVLAGRTSELMMRTTSGADATWRCRESPDGTGRMLYLHSRGNCLLYEDLNPNTHFTSTFIEYASVSLDPVAVAERMADQSIADVPSAAQSRRILQVT